MMRAGACVPVRGARAPPPPLLHTPLAREVDASAGPVAARTRQRADIVSAMPPTSEVLLYLPNLIGYARLACIVYGFHAPGVFDSAVRTPNALLRYLRG